MEKEQKIVFALKVQQLMKENNISKAAASEIVTETQKNQYELNIRQAFNESRKFTLSSIAALVNIQDIEKSIASSTTSAINNFKQQIQDFPGFKNNAFHASAPSIEDLKILDTAFLGNCMKTRNMTINTKYSPRCSGYRTLSNSSKVQQTNIIIYLNNHWGQQKLYAQILGIQ